MARRVKLPKQKMAFRLDKIEDYDLDFAVDNYSDDGGSQQSADVSDHEDNTKGAPRWVYIGEDCCRKLFQLASNTDTGVIQVCGGPDKCWRAGHKALETWGEVGTYETIMTIEEIMSYNDLLSSLEEDGKTLCGSSNTSQHIKALLHLKTRIGTDQPIMLWWSGKMGRSLLNPSQSLLLMILSPVLFMHGITTSHLKRRISGMTHFNVTMTFLNVFFFTFLCDVTKKLCDLPHYLCDLPHLLVMYAKEMYPNPHIFFHFLPYSMLSHINIPQFSLFLASPPHHHHDKFTTTRPWHHHNHEPPTKRLSWRDHHHITTMTTPQQRDYHNKPTMTSSPWWAHHDEPTTRPWQWPNNDDETTMSAIVSTMTAGWSQHIHHHDDDLTTSRWSWCSWPHKMNDDNTAYAQSHTVIIAQTNAQANRDTDARTFPPTWTRPWLQPKPHWSLHPSPRRNRRPCRQWDHHQHLHPDMGTIIYDYFLPLSPSQIYVKLV